MNQNFTDLINGIADGTKDLSINALTVAGTATLNGDINLGNASGDTLTITASVGSHVPVKTDATYDIGGSSLGYRSLYLGANSHRVRILASGSTSADWSLTLPVSAGTSGKLLKTDGAGVGSWAWAAATTSKSGDYALLDTDGYGTVLVTTGASAIVITMPQAANNTDRMITIKKVDNGSGSITLTKHASDGTTVFDGAGTTFTFASGATNIGAYIAYQSDGTNWRYIDGAEIFASVQATPQNAGGTAGQFANITSVTIPPGTWLVDGSMEISPSTATVITAVRGALSVNTGNTTTDHVSGDNQFYQNVPTTNTNASIGIPGWRVRVTAATTYYLKHACNCTANNTTAAGRISGRRIGGC